jgi:translation initiation factor IF-2
MLRPCRQAPSAPCPCLLAGSTAASLPPSPRPRPRGRAPLPGRSACACAAPARRPIPGAGRPAQRPAPADRPPETTNPHPPWRSRPGSRESSPSPCPSSPFWAAAARRPAPPRPSSPRKRPHTTCLNQFLAPAAHTPGRAHALPGAAAGTSMSARTLARGGGCRWHAAASGGGSTKPWAGLRWRGGAGRGGAGRGGAGRGGGGRTGRGGAGRDGVQGGARSPMGGGRGGGRPRPYQHPPPARCHATRDPDTSIHPLRGPAPRA